MVTLLHQLNVVMYVLVWIFRLASIAILPTPSTVVADSDTYYDFHDGATLRAMSVYCQAVNAFLNWCVHAVAVARGGCGLMGQSDMALTSTYALAQVRLGAVPELRTSLRDGHRDAEPGRTWRVRLPRRVPRGDVWLRQRVHADVRPEGDGVPQHEFQRVQPRQSEWQHAAPVLRMSLGCPRVLKMRRLTQLVLRERASHPTQSLLGEINFDELEHAQVETGAAVASVPCCAWLND